MKTVQIVIYDPKMDEIFSVFDLDLPSKEFDETMMSGHEAANEVLESLGMECCLWTRLHNDKETEIWQPLLIAGTHNEEIPKEFRAEWVPQFLAAEFIDCKTNGNWKRKMIVNNLPDLIAQDILKEFEEKRKNAAKRGYTEDDKEV